VKASRSRGRECWPSSITRVAVAIILVSILAACGQAYGPQSSVAPAEPDRSERAEGLLRPVPTVGKTAAARDNIQTSAGTDAITAAGKSLEPVPPVAGRQQTLQTVELPSSSPPPNISTMPAPIHPDSAEATISVAPSDENAAAESVDIQIGGGLVRQPEVGMASADLGRVTEVSLPRAFPWPPPRPSARLIINQQLINATIAPVNTLGQVADKLQESLSGAGYEGSGFLAAPNGFVIVTQVEQTDAEGSPISGHRWVGDIAAGGSFSLNSIIRLLVAAPAGYFRVIVFVVSDHPEAGGEDNSEKLELLRRWSQVSQLRLPPSVRSMPYDDSYSVTALVYEFEKHENGDDPSARVPGRLAAMRHLDGLKVKANGLQYALTGRID
jgi:hypothetical protein